MASLKKVGTQFLVDIPTLLTQRLNKERIRSSFFSFANQENTWFTVVGKMLITSLRVTTDIYI